jgi:hypothetical protein
MIDFINTGIAANLIYESLDPYVCQNINGITEGIYNIENIYGTDLFYWVSPHASVYLKHKSCTPNVLEIDYRVAIFDLLQNNKPSKIEIFINGEFFLFVPITDSEYRKIVIDTSENKAIDQNIGYYKIDMITDISYNPYKLGISNDNRDLSFQLYAITSKNKGKAIIESPTDNNVNIVYLLKLLEPKNITGGKKVRIGGRRDGGYVMLEPKEYPDNSGIAYSFGVSDYSPWDLQMAERGYHVYQYDGTIEKAPDEHPLLEFNRYNISGSDVPGPNEKTVGQIIREHNHKNENIILQMDIEGAEWDVLGQIAEEDILCFEQIIVEFHYLVIRGASFAKQVRVLERLNQTHQVIHIHGNNHSCAIPVVLANEYNSFSRDLCFFPTALEVSYVRKIDPVTKKAVFHFTPSFERYPYFLDMPNKQGMPDIYIGRFNIPNNNEERIYQTEYHLIEIEQKLFAENQFACYIKLLAEGRLGAAEGRLEQLVDICIRSMPVKRILMLKRWFYKGLLLITFGKFKQKYRQRLEILDRMLDAMAKLL